jgi:hypothetical protein
VEAPPGGRSGAGGGSGTAAIRPDTIIDKVKISSAKDQATFRFASSDSIARFLCKIDRHPFRACTSPKTYRHLKPGKHRFQVEAVDAAGADPSPASRSLRIEPMK